MTTQSKPEVPKCELCGEPMPKGEEMFKYHGYSGNCPKPHITKPSPASTEEWEKEFDEKFVEGENYIANGNKLGTKEAIKDFIRSHDQQLRQRIVAKVQKILDDTAAGEENNDFEAAKTMHNGLKDLITNL